ncbi:MAG TPA: hypothetical protein VI111_04440 [Thermoleophilaceae bacterium]
MALQLVERFGRALGFSPEGRDVRVWVQGAPGGDETVVVSGTISASRPDGALIALNEPVRVGDRELRCVLAVPEQRGWGLQALWFSFIAVDVYDPAGGGALARWFVRLRKH